MTSRHTSSRSARASCLVLLAIIGGCRPAGAPYLLDAVVPQTSSAQWRGVWLQRAGELGYTGYEGARALERLSKHGLRAPDSDSTGWILAEKDVGCGFLNLGCTQYDLLIAVDALESEAGKGRVQIIVYTIKQELFGGHEVSHPSAAARSDAEALRRLIHGLP